MPAFSYQDIPIIGNVIRLLNPDEFVREQEEAFNRVSAQGGTYDPREMGLAMLHAERLGLLKKEDIPPEYREMLPLAFESPSKFGAIMGDISRKALSGATLGLLPEGPERAPEQRLATSIAGGAIGAAPEILAAIVTGGAAPIAKAGLKQAVKRVGKQAAVGGAFGTARGAVAGENAEDVANQALAEAILMGLGELTSPLWSKPLAKVLPKGVGKPPRGEVTPGPQTAAAPEPVAATPGTAAAQTSPVESPGWYRFVGPRATEPPIAVSPSGEASVASRLASTQAVEPTPLTQWATTRGAAQATPGTLFLPPGRPPVEMSPSTYRFVGPGAAEPPISVSPAGEAVVPLRLAPGTAVEPTPLAQWTASQRSAQATFGGYLPQTRTPLGLPPEPSPVETLRRAISERLDDVTKQLTEEARRLAPQRKKSVNVLVPRLARQRGIPLEQLRRWASMSEEELLNELRRLSQEMVSGGRPIPARSAVRPQTTADIVSLLESLVGGR